MDRRQAITATSQLRLGLAALPWAELLECDNPDKGFLLWMERAKELALHITETEEVPWEDILPTLAPALTDTEAIKAHVGRFRQYAEILVLNAENYFTMAPRTNWARSTAEQIASTTGIVGLRRQYAVAAELWRLKSASPVEGKIPEVSQMALLREVNERTKKILAVIERWSQSPSR